MIYTVTLNPSLDYIVSVPEFQLGKTNRTVSELMLPGGKGINVSMVLQGLGMESVALGFTAGFVGDEIRRRLDEMGIRTDFISVGGVSRINLKLKDIEGTEINGRGPDIDSKGRECLMGKLAALGEGDVLFLSGSVPASMSDDIYRDIMKITESRGVCTVVDAAGELLKKTLSCHPFLVKPNLHELGELFHIRFDQRSICGSGTVWDSGSSVHGAAIEDGCVGVVHYARELQAMGARNVMVSMAGFGAVLVAEDGSVWQAAAPEGKLVNGVGAGDSMVAGFMAGWLERRDYAYAFRRGVAAGSASAFSEYLCTEAEVEAVYQRTEVTSVPWPLLM